MDIAEWTMETSSDEQGNTELTHAFDMGASDCLGRLPDELSKVAWALDQP